MNQTPVQPINQARPAAPASAGCVEVGLVILMVVWVLIATAVSQVISSTIEQAFFEGSFKIADVRWLVTIGYALAVLVPAAIIWAAGQNFLTRRIFGVLALAAGFTLLLAPARLAGITAALGTNALLIAGELVFLALFGLLIGRGRRVKSPWAGAALALGLAGLLGYPWLAWGAFGSAWDIGLALAVALLFGAAGSRITRLAFQPARAASAVLLNGLAAALVLLVMANGVGVNGNQGLLTLAVPVLGWAMAALYQSRPAPVDATGAPGSPAGWAAAENGRTLALLAGLAAFWPMALIDPDELSVVISSGSGELLQWAYLAAGVSLALGLAAGLLLLLLHGRRTQSGARAESPRAATILALLVWIGAAGLYVGIGQPGLYGERLFVILKDQADVSSAAQTRDYHQRRATVYHTLVQKADTTQAGIRQTLDQFGIPYQPYYLENAIEVQGGPLLRWWLASRPEVDRVLDNPMLRPLPEPLPQARGQGAPPTDTPWNLKMIGADRVWSELGVTGKGVVVGQSDSGVQGDHPEVADSYRGQGGKNEYNWFDPWYHSPAPTDIGGHGTHTLGTILGDHVGVAPDAQWIGCVNLARNLGNPALYLDCMQFMLAPFPQQGNPLRDGRPELGAEVLNNSWGCPVVEGCDPNALLAAVTALKAAGVFVVASAGNEGLGGCASVEDPIALYAQVYSVGAVNASGMLANFSSLGPVKVDGSGRTKPDIAAPGEEVLSAFPGNSYATESGTSMAGPHVVGVVALMWSANPALVGDIERTTQILDQTALPYQGALPGCVGAGKPNNGVGYGIVNAYAAVRMAMGK